MLSHHRASGLVAASECAHVQFLASNILHSQPPQIRCSTRGGIIEKPSGVPLWRRSSLLLMALHGRPVTASVSKGKGSECYAFSPSIRAFHFYKDTISFSHYFTDSPPSNFSLDLWHAFANGKYESRTRKTRATATCEGNSDVMRMESANSTA